MAIAPLHRPEAPLRPVVRRYKGRLLSSHLGESVASQVFALLKALGLINASNLLEYLTPGKSIEFDLGGTGNHSPPTAQQTPASGRAEHPILKTLRLRAGVELLAWLGVYWIPARLLDLLHQQADPGVAIQQFARSLDCNPEALRLRNPGELSRFRVLTTLLCQVESLPEALSASQLRHLEYLVYRGERERAAEVQWAVAMLTEACGIYRSLLTEPIQGLKLEARQLELRRLRAHLLSRTDVEASIKLANERDRLVRIFRLCRNAFETIQNRIVDSALLTKQQETASELSTKVAHVEDMLRILKENEKADLIQIIGELKERTQELEERTVALVEELSPLGQDTPSQRRQTSLSLEGKAAAIFGLSLEPLPARADVESAFLGRFSSILAPDQDRDARTDAIRDAIAWRQILLDFIAAPQIPLYAGGSRSAASRARPALLD